MSRRTTVNLWRVITQVSIQEEYWGWMSDGSFAQTSVSSRQHAHIGCVFAWHNTRHKRICRSRTNPTCWCPQTKGACFFFTYPFGMILAWLGRESCQFLLGAPRPQAVVYSGSAPYGLPRVGTGSEWALLESPLLLHLLLKVDSEKSHRSQWRRIAICEESRTNTQGLSQVSLLLPQTLLSTRKGSLRRPPGPRFEPFASRTRSEVCPGVVCKAPISSDCNLAELASPVPVRF